MTKKMYKIRNSKGLFSTGGKYPTFTKTGKIWSSISNVQKHLDTGCDMSLYEDCELVEVVVTYGSTHKNSLQIMHEQSIVKFSINSPTWEFFDLFQLLENFVKTGKCYSDEFKDYIVNKRTKFVEMIVPDYIIENFDLFHNKGIKGCTEHDLAAIMLTASSHQQKIFDL